MDSLPVSAPFPLLDFPAELIYATAEYLNLSDLKPLLETNRHLNALLTPLFRRIAVYHKHLMLSWAVDNQNEATLKQAVEYGAGVNGESVDGMAALNMAAGLGWTDTVGLLLDHGADIEQRCMGYGVYGGDYIKQTPLIVAASNGHEETALLLITRGADIYATDIYFRTPFVIAASRGLQAVVMALLNEGYDINHRLQYYTQTALHVAVMGGHLELTKMLLEYGIDPRVRTVDNKTALHLACSAGVDTAFVKMLLESGLDIDSLAGLETPLSYAVSSNNCDVAKLLLEQGADPDIRLGRGITALYLAVRNRSEELVKAILEKGADVNILDDSGASVSCNAASFTPSILSILLDYGLDIKHQFRGNSALHTVLSTRPANPELEAICKLLLDKGIDINARNLDGNTALHLAAALPASASVVTLLIEYGADIGAVDKRKDTPLQVALISAGTLAMLKVLLKARDNARAAHNNGRTEGQRKVLLVA